MHVESIFIVEMTILKQKIERTAFAITLRALEVALLTIVYLIMHGRFTLGPKAYYPKIHFTSLITVEFQSSV